MTDTATITAAAADTATATATAADAHEHPASGTVSYSGHKDDVLKRLRRIEGQVRGLQRLVEEDTYCIDVLTQVSATTKALQSFAFTLLEEHLNSCVTEAVRRGGDEGAAKVAEATAAIGRIMRT